MSYDIKRMQNNLPNLFPSDYDISELHDDLRRAVINTSLCAVPGTIIRAENNSAFLSSGKHRST